jgi:hypothetical protein
MYVCTRAIAFPPVSDHFGDLLGRFLYLVILAILQDALCQQRIPFSHVWCRDDRPGVFFSQDCICNSSSIVALYILSKSEICVTAFMNVCRVYGESR